MSTPKRLPCQSWHVSLSPANTLLLLSNPSSTHQFLWFSDSSDGNSEFMVLSAQPGPLMSIANPQHINSRVPQFLPFTRCGFGAVVTGLLLLRHSFQGVLPCSSGNFGSDCGKDALSTGLGKKGTSLRWVRRHGCVPIQKLGPLRPSSQPCKKQVSRVDFIWNCPQVVSVVWAPFNLFTHSKHVPRFLLGCFFPGRGSPPTVVSFGLLISGKWFVNAVGAEAATEFVRGANNSLCLSQQELRQSPATGTSVVRAVHLVKFRCFYPIAASCVVTAESLIVWFTIIWPVFRRSIGWSPCHWCYWFLPSGSTHRVTSADRKRLAALFLIWTRWTYTVWSIENQFQSLE